MEKEAQGKDSKESESKLSDSSQMIKTIKSNSAEKISNAQTDQQQKGKSTSKLPRIIRMPSRFYKPIDKVSKSNDDSGDIPGPSRFVFQSGSVKKEDVIQLKLLSVKLATSHIPRLKAQKEGRKENSLPAKRSRPENQTHFIPESRNVQRVNILINPEFCPGDHTPPTSVQSTRPIPSLGQIYGHINMIDSDRLNDWFMEFTTPITSTLESTLRTTETSSIPNDFTNSLSSLATGPAHCHQEDIQKTSTVVIDNKNHETSGFKAPNDNVNVWISTDLDSLTKDNGLGYKSLSRPNLQNSMPSVIVNNAQAASKENTSMKLNVTYCVGLSNDNSKITTGPNVDLERSTDTKSLIKEQPTVVIVKQKVEDGTSTSKSYVSHKTSRAVKQDATTNKSISNNQTVVTPTSRIPVPSYTDCLSEVLQKTTNFEIIDAIESTKSPSSSVTANNETQDSTSTKDTSNALCDKESTTIESSYQHQSKTSSDMTFLKSDATVAHKWSYKSRSENSSACLHKSNKNYCDDSHHNGMKERCKKCQRFKRFPSSRYKLPRNFGLWRNRISIRRLCCRRWNHVWKKTTERWAMWSTRSPKSRRIHGMHLTPSVLWEDVNIQTNTLIYNETGTNSVMKEQKSAAITTMFNMGTIQHNSKLIETESNIMETSNKGLSGFQFLQYQQKSTSFDENLTLTTCTDTATSSCKSVKSCQHEETEDLQVFRADRVTDPISAQHLRRHVSNMTNIPQKLVTCNNAETDMMFSCFGTKSEATTASASDIIFYRPMISTDITHLVSETKTQQALYPILKKYYSSADSPGRRGVGKRSVSTSVVNTIERVDLASQTKETQEKFTEDTSTEMTPVKQISVVSMGFTPSDRVLGQNAEVLVSESLLVNAEAEKENLAVQTRLTAPELVFGVTKLLSISSKQLSKYISKAAKQTQTDKKSAGMMKGLRSTAVVDSKLGGSNITVVSKPTTENIVSRPDDATSTGPYKTVSCGTDARGLFFMTKSTSARGLESYYETEILLNNLIKKALISNCGLPPHSHTTSPFPDKSETSIRSRNVMQMNTSTSYTDIKLDSKSAGPAASDGSKLVGIHKTDAEIQYVELQDKTVPQCTAIMTSYCGLPESIQVPTETTSDTIVDKKESLKNSDTSRTYNVGFDIETNTDFKLGPLKENLAQTSTVQTKQETVAVNICRNCLKQPKSMLEDQTGIPNPLISLSRLIGKKRTESAINSASVNKWLSEYTSMETALKYVMPPDGESQMKKSRTFSLKTDIDDDAVELQCEEDIPSLLLSRDSLADVLPVLKSKDVRSRKSDTIVALSRVMIDQFTSDDYVTKDVKESMLQASPEICDTGTESSETHTKHSASVFTTQCVLPSAPSCTVNFSAWKRNPNCVFVYGEPRCVVHKDVADAAVQPDPPHHIEVKPKKECLTFSVGQLTSCCASLDQNRLNPSALIKEILSPKVYKALYETTKLVVSKDAKHLAPKTTTYAPIGVDVGVEAAMVDIPALKSASILTSEVVVQPRSQQCHCSHDNIKPEHNCKCVVPQTAKDVECFTTSQEIHKDNNDECCEGCMKRHLVTSCRYYSNLLTKQFGCVKNLTKHLVAPVDVEHAGVPLSTEACTMKPSGRNVSASQTLRHHSPYFHQTKNVNYCSLSPATSLTNICKYDKAHLNSVYYMLSAIEGRLRRLKLSAPSSYCQ